MQKTQQVKLNKIPNLGYQLLLEYEHINNIDPSNKELIKKEINEFFKRNNVEIIEQIELEENDQQYTLTFALADGYLNFQCFPKQNNFISFDMNIFDPSKQQLLDDAYIHFANYFGNLQCKTSFYQVKGVDNKFLLNSNEFTSAIYKFMKLIYREKSDFSELRVFDNEFMGRILCIDDQMKLSDTIENDYSKDITKEVIDEKQEIERVLIIGGANTQIATYLLRKFMNIKKIVICDIDSKIIDVVLKYFKNAQEIQDAIKSQKLELHYENGGKYIKDLALKGEKFDAIIIDTANTNQGNWNNQEQCIFTKDFYENLKQIIKEGGKFSQQVVNDNIKIKFEATVNELQMKVEYVLSKTDDYGLDLPIAICKF